MKLPDAFPDTILPAGVRSRFVEGVNGLRVHILEAGFDGAPRPMILLVHGFPELAFSWRKIIGPLAAAGYHVVAPDLRGYGRTTGWEAAADADVEAFRILSFVTDATALVAALGMKSVAAVVGHDFGSPVAAWCALARPDVFPAVALMSAPFAGTQGPPIGGQSSGPDIHAGLAGLPRPRKHYVRYYATPQANADMMDCPQGLHAFLRAYYNVKSADWPGNAPFPLRGWTAEELAKLPTYYVMDLAADMAATVAPFMPSPAQVAACRWLTEADLAVYAGEFQRTGLQGGLNCYRGMIEPDYLGERVFAGRTIDVPAVFISGASDWGIRQSPGALEAMQAGACTRLQGVHLIEGAGHWVQQEQPAEVSRLLLQFLRSLPHG